MQLNSYLHFNGQCEQAFRFYEKCLGGKIDAMIAHEGTPAAEHVPAAWRSKIMYARMTVGSQVLMGMDAPPERFNKPQGFHVNIGVKDTTEGKRIFQALACDHAVRAHLLGTRLRHGRGSVRHSVDDQLRTGGLNFSYG
jgi:PhnB protein